ncbi:hypothetical protein PVAP13_4KG265705 [Panicum virgatum]|uniref:Secreted protein n=1 Tax=Panicum virgatum TaxID=38727 RepID=A0A8T0TN68_PANVG|nr:hypothetical protein PVAP13_4KG265705 [Panicum virgatum]
MSALLYLSFPLAWKSAKATIIEASDMHRRMTSSKVRLEKTSRTDGMDLRAAPTKGATSLALPSGSSFL